MSKAVERIGVLGGSFNPIHFGHLEMARAAHEQYHLPKILLSPTAQTYYKSSKDLLPPEARCEMVRLAIQPYPYMELSTVDVRRGGDTYTADTIRDLLPLGAEIFFLVGADSLCYMETWKDCAYLFRHCTIMAASREGILKTEEKAHANMLRQRFGAKILPLSIRPFPHSSTEIRERLRRGEDVSALVPSPVCEFIRKEALYR